MKKFLSVCLTAIFTFSQAVYCSSGENSLNAVLSEPVNKIIALLNSSYPAVKIISVTGVSDKNNLKVPSYKIIGQELNYEFVRQTQLNKNISVIDQSTKDKVLATLNEGYEWYSDETRRKEFGKRLNADAIAIGKITDKDDYYLLDIQMIDIESGKSICASDKIKISKDLFSKEDTATICILTVNTEPAQSQAYIDGINAGETPCDLQLSEKKEYRLTVKKEGFEDYTKTISTKKKEDKIFIKLKELPVLKILTVPEHAKVFINYDFIGTAPINKPLPFGQYQLSVSKGGYKSYLSQIEIKDSKSSQILNIALQKNQVAQDQSNQAVQYYNEGKYQEAFKLFEASAAQGVDQSQYYLGLMHYNEETVEQNYKKVFDYWKASAEQGYDKAQKSLADLYYYGNGVEQDFAQALKWYVLSAKQDNDLSQAQAGLMYYNGQGVDKDLQQAVTWFKEAAMQGNSLAQYYLGLIYLNAEDTEQNIPKALKYFEDSSEDGYYKAKLMLAKIYFEGRLTEKDRRKASNLMFVSYKKNKPETLEFLSKINTKEAELTLSELYCKGKKDVDNRFLKAFEINKKYAGENDPIAEILLAKNYFDGKGVEKNKDEGFKWLNKAIKQNSPEAMYELSKMYYNGENVEKNENKGFELLQQSADLEYDESENSLGFACEHGKGTQQDLQKAFQWYKKAAEQGNASAQHNLARFYNFGLGDIPVNHKRALQWYKKAANQEYDITLYNLGTLYYSKFEGIPQNYKLAFEWYKKAAEQGYMPAQNAVGLMYENGQGVQQSYDKALEYYMLSAEQNSPAAQYNLGLMYEKGNGVEQNWDTAFQWINKAAGHKEYKDEEKEALCAARYELGKLYYKGRGTKENKEEAKRLWKLSAEGGCKDAQKLLETIEQKGVPEINEPDQNQSKNRENQTERPRRRR